ncbi:MAG: hypothetical protein ACYCWW_09580 [Deltaproteobacteria bacterium]
MSFTLLALSLSGPALLPPNALTERLVLADPTGDFQPYQPSPGYTPPPAPTKALLAPPESPSPAVPIVEAAAADFGLRLVLDGGALTLATIGALTLLPPCGGRPSAGSMAAGYTEIGLGAVALGTELLLSPSLLDAILEANGYEGSYGISLGGELLGTFFTGPLTAYLAASLTSVAFGNSPSGGGASAVAAGLGYLAGASVAAAGFAWLGAKRHPQPTAIPATSDPIEPGPR